MSADLITGLLGNLGYDLIKQFGANLFGTTDSELDQRIRKAINNSFDRFHQKYGNKFGRPYESFLAKSSNWLLIAESLKLDSTNLEHNQIDRTGYGNFAIPTDEEIDDLFSIVKSEFQQDLFLDLKLSIKESMRLSDEKYKSLTDALEKLGKKISLSDSNINGSYDTYAKGGDLPPQDHFEEGVLYVRNINNNVKLSYMRRGRIIYSEAELDDGAVMYFEIDENALIRIVQPPYPVNIYIPPEYKVREEIITDETGSRLYIQYCKFGLKVTSKIRDDGTYYNTKFENASYKISSKDRVMIVTPNISNNVI